MRSEGSEQNSPLVSIGCKWFPRLRWLGESAFWAAAEVLGSSGWGSWYDLRLDESPRVRRGRSSCNPLSAGPCDPREEEPLDPMLSLLGEESESLGWVR